MAAQAAEQQAAKEAAQRAVEEVEYQAAQQAARLAAHDQPATAPPVRGATPPPPRLNVAGNIQSVAAAPAPSHPRVHIVKPRETVHSIALQYGLSVSTVLAANPRVDPRRLRIGQNLALP